MPIYKPKSRNHQIEIIKSHYPGSKSFEWSDGIEITTPDGKKFFEGLGIFDGYYGITEVEIPQRLPFVRPDNKYESSACHSDYNQDEFHQTNHQ
ncbi:MAG: hypothetical protein K8T10_16225 [Candidatus Eremiobacteraeota bacterium]|nr:hypothetical protein [Candidatus Eremiobacteraeota bacterium]